MKQPVIFFGTILRPGAVIIVTLALLSCSVRKAPAYKGRPGVLNLNVTGDIMVHERVYNGAYRSECDCYDFNDGFANMRTLLALSDLTVGNLETTFPGDRRFFSGYPMFGSPASLADTLKWAGFDVLVTANNHSCDKGERGIDNTIDVLDKLGIVHTGTWKSEKAFKDRPYIELQKNGVRAALANFTYGTNYVKIPPGRVVSLLTEENVRAAVEKMRKAKPDFVMVFFHFGREYLNEPDNTQKRWVDFAFNEGVDVVLGAHPHTVQPLEYRLSTDRHGNTFKRLALFSMGNFYSGQNPFFTRGGVLVNLDLVRADNPHDRQVNINFIEPVFVYRQKRKKVIQYVIYPVGSELDTRGGQRLDKRQLADFTKYRQHISGMFNPHRVSADPAGPGSGK